MKIRLFKQVVIAVACVVISTLQVVCQTAEQRSGRSEAGQPGASQSAASAESKAVRIASWGVVSLNVPTQYSVEDTTTEPNENKGVKWTEFSRQWSKPKPDPAAPSEEILLMVTTWNAAWTDVTQRKELNTPEALLALDFATDQRVKDNGTAPIEELSYMDLDGVKGEFFAAKQGDTTDRVWLNWHTYRNFQGKPQRISLSIMGKRTDRDDLMKILHSLKLSN